MHREVPRNVNPHTRSLPPGLASPIIWNSFIPGPPSIEKHTYSNFTKVLMQEIAMQFHGYVLL